MDVAEETAAVGVAFTDTSAGVAERLYRTQQLVCEMGSWRVVMRDEQAELFAAVGRERPQYAEPNVPDADAPDPGVPNPDVPQYAPGPDGDIDCSTYSGPPIPVPPGSDGDGLACE